MHIVSGVGGRLLLFATHALAWQGSDTPQSASVAHASSLFFGAGSLQAKRASGLALSLGGGALASVDRVGSDSGAGAGGAIVTSAAVGASVPWLQAAATREKRDSARRPFTGANLPSFAFGVKRRVLVAREPPLHLETMLRWPSCLR